MLNKRLTREAAIEHKHWLKLFFFSSAAAICTVTTAYYLAAIIDGVFLKNLELAKVVPFFSVLLFVMFTKAIAVWLNETATHTLAEHVKTDLRLKLLYRLAVGGPVPLGREQTGELVALLTDGIEQLDSYFTKFLPQLITATTTLLTILIVVLSLDLLTALILLVTAPLIPIFMFLIGKLADQANLAQWQTLSTLSARFFDLIEGLTTLKIFGQSLTQIRKIEQLGNDFHDATLRVLRVAFLSAFVLELAATLSVAIIAVTIGLRLLEGQIDFARAFFLLLLAPEFYLPLRQFGSAFHSAASGIAAAERIYQILDLPFETVAAPPKLTATKVPFKSPIAIRFDNVYFSYEKNRGAALNGLSMTINAGERVAIVGASGAGKTTAAYLLLQFIHPTKGRILANEQCLSIVSPEIWRNSVAYVPQSPHIFCLNAAENIALAKPTATLEEISCAAIAAGAHDFINALPHGYQTILGEGGQPLSGGQARRIAISRAFLKNAPLILLDEAMTGLDIETELAIEAALARLAAGRTLIMIVHKLHSAETANHIIVLENGQAVESGNHKVLLAKNGYYSSLLAATEGESCISS